MKSQEQYLEAERPANDRGRAYRPPELFVYGDVRELTLSNAPTGGMLDGRILGRTEFRT